MIFMKNINLYITEKLHLNKDIEEVDNTLKEGDPIFEAWFEAWEDEESGDVFDTLRVVAERDLFVSLKDDKLITRWDHKKYSNEDEWDVFINKFGYIERKTFGGIFLSFKDAKNFLEELIKTDTCKEACDKVLSQYFETKDNKPISNVKAMADNNSLKKILRIVNAKLK